MGYKHPSYKTRVNESSLHAHPNVEHGALKSPARKALLLSYIILKCGLRPMLLEMDDLERAGNHIRLPSSVQELRQLFEEQFKLVVPKIYIYLVRLHDAMRVLNLDNMLTRHLTLDLFRVFLRQYERSKALAI